MASALAPSSLALSNSPLPLDGVPNIAQETVIFGTFRRQRGAQGYRGGFRKIECLFSVALLVHVEIADNCGNSFFSLLT
jgi:hypothetical protein